MNQRKLFIMVFVILYVTACSRNVIALPIVQTPQKVLETPTVFPIPTKQPTIILTPQVFFVLTSPVLENGSYVNSEGELWVHDKYVFDVSAEFCGVGWEIDSVLIPPLSLFFSPDSEYVLIDIHCIEGINKGFIVRMDPVHQLMIATGGADLILGDHVQWSPDSKSIVYFRLSGCCSDAPSMLPSGFILYNLETGSKLFLTDDLEYDEFPVWSPNGHWLAYILDII